MTVDVDGLLRDPVAIAAVFCELVDADDGRAQQWVTPELSGPEVEALILGVRAVLAGGAWPLSRARRATMASDVAYVVLTAPEAAAAVVPSVAGSLVEVHVLSLVWRPELGCWRVHGVGGFVHPDALPRTSHDEAP
ncbi:hypothetical protein [Herbiconiux sp. L3-i23]|uniref:hypothetical protein n=1 Tax=Herbiconiux sp. L3-i23 TaxID=2905871 RepID=UPI0020526F04|nr:hypothetical protein [Herbiconiux sp. L3-i23]BDI23535.1 hypothetical protein L3i23_23110 [Herbiconiux sp. L3-i23]